MTFDELPPEIQFILAFEVPILELRESCFILKNGTYRRVPAEDAKS